MTSNLTKIADDIFTIAFGATLKFTLTGQNTNLVNEIGAFTVDDASGKINGIAPNTTGYAQAALERSKVVFSTINNIPNGFDTSNLSSLLKFNAGDNFRFYLVKNNTTNSVKSGTTPLTDLLFSNPVTQKIIDLDTKGFSLNWNDNSANNGFNNLSIKVQSTNDPLPLGTNLQGFTEGRVLDLRGQSGIVKVDFTVNREAAYNNFIGFYKVDDQTGAVGGIKPTDAGYAQAAIEARVTGIDLTVNNQATANFSSKQLTGGAIYAPFIIVNGTVDQFLNGQTDLVYFNYLGANPDKVDHVRLLANNTFGFEDLYGGGDRDYNDMIVKATLKV